MIRAALVAAILLACLVAPSVAQAQSGPQLRGAKSAIVIEASTGQAAYKRDAGDRRQIASTTKMMTALVTLQHADLDDVFRASNYDPAPIESQIGLRPGERMSVRDLMRGLLLPSGNDAAMALAVGVSGSRNAFVRAMNTDAERLGLARHALREPDRARRGHELLDRRRPGEARRGPAAQRLRARDDGSPARDPADGLARAHRRSTATRSSRSTRGSTG